MNKTDSYSQLINLFRDEGSAYNPPSIRLGEIISKSPLLIKVDELQLTKDEILINHTLLDHEYEFSIPSTSASGSCTNGSISSISIPNGKINIKNILKIGDLVSIQPTADKEIWIILNKVVRP